MSDAKPVSTPLAYIHELNIRTKVIKSQDHIRSKVIKFSELSKIIHIRSTWILP